MNEKWEPVDYDCWQVGDELRRTDEDKPGIYIVTEFVKEMMRGYSSQENRWERRVKEKPMNEKLEGIIAAVIQEFKEATSKFKGYNSAHEGYAVILEELDELWDEVKKKESGSQPRCPQRMREEAIQVAVTAIRFVHDLSVDKCDCTREDCRGRK